MKLKLSAVKQTTSASFIILFVTKLVLLCGLLLSFCAPIRAGDKNPVRKSLSLQNAAGALAGGTYTVGAGKDYASITAALADYNSATSLTGNVIFELTDATYDPFTETFPLTINSPVNGSGFLLTIQPSQDFTNYRSIAGAVPGGTLINILSSNILINGCSNNGNVTTNLYLFNAASALPDPSVITIGSTGTTPVTNVTIQNCDILNAVKTGKALIIGDNAVLGDPGYFNNISIERCTLHRALTGIYCAAVPTGTNGSGLSIKNNSIGDDPFSAIRNTGIWVKGVNGAVIQSNNISGFENTTAEIKYGIWLGAGTQNCIVSENSISGLDYTGSGVGYGVGIYADPGLANANITIYKNLIESCTSSGTTSGNLVGSGIALGASANGGITISNNIIGNIKNTNASGYGAAGIVLNTSLSAANIAVYNNFVFDIAARGYGSGTADDNGNGIVIINGGGYNIDYNTVRLTSEQTANIADAVPAPLNIGSGVTGQINLRNNIFSNEQATNSTYHYAVYSEAPASVFAITDHNDYYAPASPALGFLGFPRAALADWQTATGQDANSLSADPSFLTVYEYHLNSTSPLNGKAIPIAGITTDYDNNTRQASVPDIGCVEIFGTNLSDLALSSGTLNPVFTPAGITYTATVTNAVNSITVTPTLEDALSAVTVNGTPVTSGNASGAISLNVGSNVITVEVTALDALSTKTYTVTVTRSANTLDIIDVTATSPAAFSVRLLSTGYTGYAMKVRRSSDNTLLDIGFVNGHLDTAALKTFIGADNGFIDTWYDQSGYERNATQATLALQPQIAEAGVIMRKNGRPTAYFNSTKLGTPAFTGGYSSGFTLAIVAGVKVNTANPAFGGKTNSNLPSPWDMYGPNFITGNGTGAGFIFMTLTSPINVASGFSQWIFSSNSTQSLFFKSGVANGTGVPSAFGETNNSIYLGTRSDGASELNGWISEYVTTNSLLSASDRNAVSMNQALYYSQSFGTPPTITPGGPTTFCGAGSVTLTSSATTGNQWYLNGIAISGETNQQYIATATGSYTVTQTESGLTTDPSTAVSVVAAPVPSGNLTPASQNVCSGNAITDIAFSGGGAGTPVTFNLQTSYTFLNTDPNGIFFDITNSSAQPIKVNSVLFGFFTAVDVNTTTNADFTIYRTTTASSAEGNYTNSAAWTIVAQGPYAFDPAPANNGWLIAPGFSNGGFVLAPGESVGMYIVTTTNNFKIGYRPGGGYTATNTDGIVTVSSRYRSSGLFAVDGVLRSFSGNINYTSGTTASWVRDNTTNITGTASGTSATISGTLVNTTMVPQTTTYTYTTTSVYNCTSTTTATVTVNPNTWTGAVSSAWNNSGNWTCGIPASGDNVVIGTGPNMPLLPGDFIINNLYLQTGTSLSIGSNTLTVSGDITGLGTFTGSANSSMIFSGSVAKSVSFTPGSRVIKNLTLNGTGIITLATPLRIAGGALAGTVIVNAGASLNSAGNLTIGSEADGTARIGASAGTITNDVIIERYIPQNANRAWRFLSAPASGTTINASWQEGQSNAVNNLPGYGTLITTASAANIANGFDAVTTGTSILTYNASGDNWNDLSGTNINMNSFAAYMVYIRGDRSANVSSSTASTNATTLRAKGTVYQGAQGAVNAGANEFTAVGNLYASAIDFNRINASGNIDQTYYVWDPKLAGAYGIGGYVTITTADAGATWFATPATGSYAPGNINPYIESGQAFFIHSTGGSGTIALNENSKTTAPQHMVFAPVTAITKFGTTLLAGTGLTASAADGNLVIFDNAFDNGVDGKDALKMNNFAENLGILRNGKKLSVEKRSALSVSDTIYFSMKNLKQQNYTLRFAAENINNATNAFLIDNYLHTTSAIDVINGTDIVFAVTAAGGSSATDRFMVVFSPAAPLPVTFTNVNANRTNGGIQVNWKVASESGIEHYDVERSADGITFNKIRSAPAIANNSNAANYVWLDMTAGTGIYYYRIKSIGHGAEFKYSNVVKVAAVNAAGTITIAPNPVVGNIANLQFVNQPDGIYVIQFYNNTGQLVHRASVTHTSGSSAEQLQLPKTLHGIYEAEIINTDGIKNTIRVIIN